MNPYHLLVAAIAAGLLAGCASTDTATPTQSPDDKSYTTGSRIPVKEPNSGVKSVSDKKSIDDIMQRGSIYMPAKPGG